MPKYVYHYFDIRGRGEPGRMLFAMAGIPFQDERIPQSDWPQYKASKLCYNEKRIGLGLG